MNKPFVTILNEKGGRPELWLVEYDEQGLIKPVGNTGPIRMPPEWVQEIARCRPNA